MTLPEFIKQRYPNASFGENYEIVDDGDGLLRFGFWNVLNDDGNPINGPSSETLMRWKDDVEATVTTQPPVGGVSQPFLRARLKSVQQINRYAYTRARFESVEEDGISVSDGVVTFSETGLYLVLVRMRIDASAASSRSFACRALQNGNFDEWLFNEPMYSTRRYKKWQKLMSVEAGDTLEFQVVHSIDGTIQLNNAYQYLEGVKIRDLT